jgi:hypothetical protein
MMTIAEAVAESGRKALAAEGSLADALNEALQTLLAWPFRIRSAAVVDADGNHTDAFGSVVYTASSQHGCSESASPIHADRVACVVDVSETLDLQRLGAAYERIATAKRLKKTPAPQIRGVAHTTITLGIVVARDATVPIEALAEELDALNQHHPDREWTDMVVILRRGTINYAVQFPGKRILGDYLPPAEGATAAFTAPMYIVLVVKPTGTLAFNKMCAFLLAHAAIFSPGAKLPNWAEVLEGVPKEVMTICGYQYNLSGQIRPVPREFYNDRYLPPRPVYVEDNKGNQLAALQFLPWQDGGVVLLKGKLPLEGLLVFIGKKAFERGGIVKRGDTQLSYVTPITQADFQEILARIQRQSNMRVRVDPTSFVVQKFADEGSSSPFMARLFLGVMQLRDAVFPQQDPSREQFDKVYEFIVMTLLNTRTSAQNIMRMLSEHKQKVANGTIARLRGYNIEVDENVNKELRKEVETFLNSAVRVLKQGMQDIAKVLGCDIGFLFRKQPAFENGVATLRKKDALLAAYLIETRKWSERLIVSGRNALEHTGWMLPQVKYSSTPGGIRAEEPQIEGQCVGDFVSFMLDRLSCFVEDVAAHCLQQRLPGGLSVTEIRLADRDPQMPLRFRLALAEGGIKIWSLAYHTSTFDET